ncbi:MAG: PQQ-binding-like beta-propeller repeat protein [Bryobacteraceae bacterium]
MKSGIFLWFLCFCTVVLAADAPPPAALVEAGRHQFQTHCAGCHGGDGLGGERAPAIAHPDSPRLKSVDAIRKLLKQGIPDAGMPGFQLTPEEANQLVAFIQSRVTPIGKLHLAGDAASGKQFFFGPGHCSSCHMAQGVGALEGPDLGEIGRNKTLADVETALAKPEARPTYQVAEIKLKGGKTVKGFLKNRSNFDLQVQGFDDDLHLLKTRDVQTIAEDLKPFMPPLSATASQKRDLLAYLATLNGQVFEGTPTAKDSISLHSQFERIMSPVKGDWPTYHGNLNGNRFSPLDQITKRNVAHLAVKWSFPVKDSLNLETTPIVADGVMYITTGNQCYALDASSGREIWHYSRPLTSGQIGDAGGGLNRGVAILGDRIFMVTDNAHLIALHRLTGGLLWDTQMADSKQHYGATSAPLVVNDLVISGPSGGDEGVRGFIAAFSAQTGKEIWRFWNAPKPGEPNSETWRGRAIEHPCAASWFTGTYDAETSQLFWTTGNPCPDFNGDERQGDNLYSDSVLALDPRTGGLKWYFQFTPHDTHDWDSAETPMIVDAPFQGRPRKLLLQGNRNGFFYVLDRTDGKFLAAYPFVNLLNWTAGIDQRGRPIAKPDTEPTIAGNKICPAVEGASNWMSSSFSPQTGLFYLMALEKCSLYTKSSAWWQAGESFYGGDTREVPGLRPQKFLRAIDIQTGKIAWQIPQDGSADTWGGTLALASGLVFFMDDGGSLDAADAKSGELLWHLELNQSWHASPMTFMADGAQYLAVAAGSSVVVFGLS